MLLIQKVINYIFSGLHYLGPFFPSRMTFHTLKENLSGLIVLLIL